jgi:quinol monooxygenase YgiN
MERVARYGKTVAKEGKGEEVAGLLLEAARELGADEGCELYLINRESGRPDTVWVTEVWRSQADLEAAREKIRGSANVAAVMALVDNFEMVELDLLGGKGLR